MLHKKVDWFLIILFLMIYLVGLPSVFSASYFTSKRFTGEEYFFFYRHITTFLLGILVVLFFYKINLSFLFKYYFWFFFGSIFLLLLVFIPGISREVSGARRWLDIGVVRMQPSEVTKLFLLIFVSRLLALKQEKMTSFLSGVLPIILLSSVPIALTFLEPDISTAFLLVAVCFTLFYYGRVSLVYLIFFVCATLPFLLIFFESKRYWVSRFLFIDPEIDPYGKGYHLLQSLMGFHQGRFFGDGPGTFLLGSRKLPDAHTDFIFSVIGQELGIVGCVVLMFFMVMFVRQIFRIAFIQVEMDRHFLAIGMAVLIAYESIIHIFVTIGLIPTTGLPLPFVSFGRTSLIVHMAMLGILLNMSKQNPQVNQPLQEL